MKSIFSPEIIHHSSDESDGISVISESELCKATSENEMEDVSLGCRFSADKINFDQETPEYNLPITPPATPKNEEHEDFEPCFLNSCSRNLLFGAGFIVIVAILYSHVKMLHNEMESCKQRILRLEEENEILKASLEQLEKIANPFETTIDINQDSIDFLDIGESRALPPLTKSVWLGSESEHKVEILDKKHELPDYCYFTEEDDLFFEYNRELCEKKRQKLEKPKSSKKSKRKFERQAAVEDHEWNEKNYDDYIKETLKILNDEIEEIKRKRSDSSEVTEEDTFPENPEIQPEKLLKNKRKKQKRKDKNWLESRMKGREEARKLHEKEETEGNWYLKRKNERELDRLEAKARSS